jgi:hypothetical protein
MDDDKADLWTVFNRIQENAVKGGLRGVTAKRRRTSTKEVKGIDGNVNLNKALWILSEHIAKSLA